MMDRAIYKSLNTEQRIAHLNREMTTGKKLNLVCKEIGIADNVTTDFRRKGYVRDELGLFVKHGAEHPDMIIQDTEGRVAIIETKKHHILPSVTVIPTDAKMSEERRKPGRPTSGREKPHKLTIEISKDVYKALMFYKIDQGIYVNQFLEGLIKANVPEKYFDI